MQLNLQAEIFHKYGFVKGKQKKILNFRKA